MKRPIFLLVTAALVLTLTACSPAQTRAPFPRNLPLQLLETEAFSEPLEPLEPDLVWALYDLEDAGLARESLADAQSFRSTGATCEELTLLTFADEPSAQTAANALDLYIINQIQINKDYRPAELAKLEKAFLERRGSAVLLMVANDYNVTHELLAP